MPLSPPRNPQLDDVMIEYHPHSERATIVTPLHELKREGDAKPVKVPKEEEPWKKGFRTRIDFDVCTFALDARLNKKQTSSLLKLLKAVAENPKDLTVQTLKDVDTAWNRASSNVAKVIQLATYINSCTHTLTIF